MGLSLFILLLGIYSAALYSAVTCTSWQEGLQITGPMNTLISPLLARRDVDGSKTLHVDEASVYVENQIAAEFDVYAQYDMCWKCPLLHIGDLHEAHNVTFIFNTWSPINISLTDAKNLSNIVCGFHTHLVEHGRYSLNVSLNRLYEIECALVLLNDPFDSNLPIYIALTVLFACAVLFGVGKVLYRKYRGSQEVYVELIPDGPPVEESDSGTPSSDPLDVPLPPPPPGTPSSDPLDVPLPPPPPPQKQRLQSLDTFRGLSLVIMIFVNYKGGKYWFFHHSAWNGITLADTVFPWFTFIMGTSIALAFRSLLRRGKSRRSLALKVLKRSVILFLLGLSVSNSGGVHLSTLRIPGVLQRLALSYFAVAMMEVFFAKVDDPYQGRRWSWLRDVVLFWGEWLVALSLVTIQLCFTFLLPVPGCPTGYLGPGGIESDGAYENCTGGASGYIDRQVFGENHMYGHPTCKVLYQTNMPYDPEGLLGTLTSIFMCFLGLQAGKVLLYYPSWQGRIKRWLVWAVITGTIAGILCKFSQNDGWIPVNKNFWSVSFVLALASMAYVLLTVLYIVVDVLKLWGGAPFIFPGMNSIVVYLCSEILQDYFPVQFVVSNSHAALLPMHMYGAAVWTIMAAGMYYKDVFIAI